MRKNIYVLRNLLKGHVNVDLRDDNGQTSLHILCNHLNGRVDRALDVCAILLEYGACVNKPSPVKMTSILTLSEFETAIALAIYTISAGGDISFVFTSSRMLELFGSFKYIHIDVKQLFLDILYESGTVLPTLDATNNELTERLTLRQANPRTLLRLAADVLRKTMLPNAWVGLKRLSMPPGFDKEYIIFDARSKVSTWFKG